MTGYHATRLAADPRRARVWQALWTHHFRHRIPGDATVLDLGCGYGDFINTVRARRRIAVDSWAGMPQHLDQGVEGHVGSVTDLSFLSEGSVDFAFASNLFEHLSQADFAEVLAQLRPKLARGGVLSILQPNYRYAYREYFDDYTHIAVYSHLTLIDFLEANGWRVAEVRPRFLPLTVKSRLPVSDVLIAAYLRSPVKPMGKQMLITACPAEPQP